jgi:hypothetical protein
MIVLIGQSGVRDIWLVATVKLKGAVFLFIKDVFL